MSRIGKLPIVLPQGVSISIKGNEVKVKGPKGELSRELPPEIGVDLEEKAVKVKIIQKTKRSKALWGLFRTLINNMVEGVSKGFERALEIEGVGYRVEQKGSGLTLNLGFSHPIEYIPPAGIEVKADKQNRIIVSGIDKEKVGLEAARIRDFRPPEPYKGKGIRYAGEYVRRKAGKSGVK